MDSTNHATTNQVTRVLSNLSSRQGQPPIYPPPSQAILPILRGSNTENSSTRSSPSPKRKRELVEDSIRSRTRVSSTSDFNNSTKARVREQYNHKCWHCGASPADVCHIIGSRDQTFHDALADGLIDFQEKQSQQNAIALCGTCHTNFDHVYNPSFFFLPTDLDYFLNYEQQDRKRRRALGRRTGTIPARMCPTARTYQAHQIHNGIEGAELGGLYTRVVTRDFTPNYPGRPPFQPGLSEYGATKPWTGSPMASLQSAVLMLRRLNLHGIPLGIRNALRQLQDAYSKDLCLDGSDTCSEAMDLDSLDASNTGGIESSTSETHLEEGREGTLPDQTKRPRIRSQQRGTEQRSESRVGEHDFKEHVVDEDKERTSTSKDEVRSEADLTAASLYSISRHEDINCISVQGCNVSPFWRWGPSATSADAVNFFQRVL